MSADRMQHDQLFPSENYEPDPQQKRFTARDMAEFWQRQVAEGRGHWSPGVCVRGLSLIRSRGRGPSLAVLPEDELYDPVRQIIFLGARDS